MSVITGDYRGKPVAAWTTWYWPASLVVALTAFFVPYYAGWHWSGYALLGDVALIVVPELWSLASGNSQNTLSDWVWRSAHITGTRPIQKWNAEQYLLLCAYLFIATNVIVYLCTVAWEWGMVSALVAFWLTFHFFGRWWT